MLVEASHRGWLEVRPATPYRDRIVAERRRIIWYAKTADLPPVTPVEAPAPDRGKGPSERAPQKIQANAPHPKSRRQMILQSPPEIRLTADLRVPNVLAWSPPVRPSEPRQRFQIQARPVQRPQPKPLEAATPEVAVEPVAAPKLPVQLPERPRFQVPERPRWDPVAPQPVAGPEAPQVAVEVAGGPSTVIVGLDPGPAPLPPPPPPGNRSADFSAGPDAVGNGGGGAANQTAELRVPHLSIAAAPAPALAGARPPAEDRAAFRRRLLSALPVTGSTLDGAPPALAPDPVLRGSTVYTMAVDMPNITSFEGSWTVRFTELGGSSPDDLLTAPVPLRKVDPKYVAAAAAEGVQGKVLLYAVIRRDGRVDQVRLVQGIDERLDAAALTAFGKWEFQPAAKNGVPVDLEAVVTIPFRLRKKSARW